MFRFQKLSKFFSISKSIQRSTKHFRKYSSETTKDSSILSKIFTILLGYYLGSLIIKSFTYVGDEEVGVVGKFKKKVLKPGFHIKNPIIEVKNCIKYVDQHNRLKNFLRRNNKKK